MKLKGKKISAPSPVHLTLFREDGNVVLTAQAVLNYKEFDKLCPAPKPPLEMKPNGEQKKVFDDPDYKIRMGEYANKRINYLIIKSLSATTDLEWETISLDDPATWDNLEKELEDVFTEGEREKIYTLVNEANNPTEKRRKEAVDHFALSQVLDQVLTSQKGEQETTPSGEPVKDSE